MRILAIETSCDETAICIIEASGSFDADFRFKVLGNALLSQIAVHAPYGGVYPNLAKREHELNLVPLLTEALQEAGMLSEGSSDTSTLESILTHEVELRPLLENFLKSHGKPAVDAIVVTHGPGLEPALWVGINFAKVLSSAWNLPIVPVNHMEGHIVLSMMEEDRLGKVRFPLLSLLISGGHTELVLSKEWMHYQMIGQTRDDAVGEAFDKVARLMDLPYPGGPEISRLAEAARAKPDTGAQEISLPRPMIDTDDYDFSFSGLKTAVRRIVDANDPLSDTLQTAIALEFENACADVLVAKTMKAIEEFGVETLVVGGGVSANTHIRARLADAIKDYGSDAKLLIPPAHLATDNALMIALAGYFRLPAQAGALNKEFAEPETIRANGNLKLT